MLEAIGLLLLGSAIPIAAQYIKNLSDRDTHASNRVLEMRLTALQSIWEKYSAAMWIFSESGSIGWRAWTERREMEAMSFRDTFRQEVDKHQMILDRSIIMAFRQIDTDLLLFYAGDWLADRDEPIGYYRFLRDHLDPHLDVLATAINEKMDVSTHQIALRFREEASARRTVFHDGPVAPGPQPQIPLPAPPRPEGEAVEQQGRQRTRE